MRCICRPPLAVLVPRILRCCILYYVRRVTQHVKYRCFHDWAAAASFLRTERGCDLCGIVRQSTPTRAQNVPTESRTMPVLEQQDTGTFDADGCPVPCDGTVSDGDDEASNVGENPAERPQETSEETSAEKPEELSEENMGVDRRSIAVRHRPFRRSTAFLVGHHGRLGHEALGLCDFLVHVEQVQKNMPSVDVSGRAESYRAPARYGTRTMRRRLSSQTALTTAQNYER